MKKLFHVLVPLGLLLMVLGVNIQAQTAIQTWDFEASVGDWVAGSDGSTVTLSTEQALSGTQSVKLVKPATGLEINFQNDAYEDVVEGDTLTFHLYLSAADLALVNGGQIYWQTGSGWTWNSQWVNGSSLTADTWNTVKHVMPAIELPLQRIGFQLLLSTGNEAEQPALYVDDVTVTRVFPSGGLITIDGEKDTFFGSLTGPDDGYLQLRAFTGNDNGFANGDADLSAKMWVAWDDSCFYVYEEVKDDMISMSSTNTYQNDGMEIKFDPQATDSVTNSIVGLQMTVQDSTGGVTGWADFPGVCARKTTADGYVLEAAIPWESIATTTESVDVAVDSVFGLCMQNHDNDNTTGARDASIQWAAVMLDAAWNQPKYLATAKFLAGNKLQLIPSNNMTGVTNTLPYDGTVPTGIVVDGKMDPFYHLLTGPDDGFIQVKSYSHSEVGTPHGDADLSAKVWGSWDTDWLYLYVEMTDDTISLAGVTNNWETDAMELKIDGWPTDSTQIGGSACSKTCIFTAIDSSVATTAAEKAVCDNLTAWADADKMYARGTRTGGYILEYAIKIDTLGGSEPIDAAVDSIFGIGMNFIDNDGLHGRQAAIIWGAISGDHIWDTVKYHGTVKFLADHKIAFIAENNMTGHVNPVPFDGTPFWMNIDAAKDPFYYTLSRPTDGYLQLRYYAWNDNGFLFDDADLSAKIWTAWDDSCFYVYEEVKDDVISMTSTNTYQNDGMELKFDPQATDSVANSIVGLQMTVQDSTGGVTGWANFPGTFARKTVSGGYVLEAAIPWSDIATTTESVDVGVNNVFGAVLQNHDNDNDTGARDGSVMWGAVMLDAAWNTPKYLGTVKFLAGNKLNYTAKNNMTGVTNSIPYDGRDYYRNAMDDTKAIAYKFSLNQNYPNPFNPITTISYGIEKASDVRLTVYDIMGRQVATLVNEAKKPGFYNVQFDASRMASGLYLYRIEAGSFVKTHKMMLLK